MSETFTFTVPQETEGVRLDRFLAESGANLTRARIKSLIDEGLAAVDGVTAKASRKLKTGQTVNLTVPELEPVDLSPDPSVRFEVLYQDAHIIVLDKPAGLVVHPAAGHASGTLVHGLLAVCTDLGGIGGEIRPGIVHRLDKDTSGVMVAAKNDRAHQVLVDMFKSRAVDKEYLALTHGRPKTLKGEIGMPIGRHPVRRKEMSVKSRNGRPALTRYRVLTELKMGAAALRLKIMTGRTHQIRVHLAAIGCPVLGDPVYGRGKGTFSRFPEIRSKLKRQMLHAQRLGFEHPVDRTPLTFESPVPGDMASVLELLGGEINSTVFDRKPRSD